MEQQHMFLGVHVLGELYGIETHLLDNVPLLEQALEIGILKSKATLCNMQTKKFDPSGVTILALLSESHTSIHTYPDRGALFFDAFTCGETCTPEDIAYHLIEVLKPTRVELKTLKRGDTVSSEFVEIDLSIDSTIDSAIDLAVEQDCLI